MSLSNVFIDLALFEVGESSEAGLWVLPRGAGFGGGRGFNSRTNGALYLGYTGGCEVNLATTCEAVLILLLTFSRFDLSPRMMRLVC